MTQQRGEGQELMEHLGYLSQDANTGWRAVVGKVRDVERLPGDASTRKYYRVFAEHRSLILMSMEPFADRGESLPFLAVQKHLSQAKVAVPEVVDFNASKGLILLEDLGDVTLLRELETVTSSADELKLFSKVVELLAVMHEQASHPSATPGLESFGMRFDFEKLNWEINFTLEHFYAFHLKREFAGNDLKKIRAGFDRICRHLESLPTVFTHRDFHSRNVMVQPTQTGDKRFVMIDFQDARLGPAQYDLASLVRDSYYQLEEAQLQKLLDLYWLNRPAVLKAGSREEFERDFDWMAVQRNFKAIGSFASFLNLRGNTAYLKYIGNTFENIRRTLLKYPEFQELRELLYHYYYF